MGFIFDQRFRKLKPKFVITLRELPLQAMQFTMTCISSSAFINITLVLAKDFKRKIYKFFNFLNVLEEIRDDS